MRSTLKWEDKLMSAKPRRSPVKKNQIEKNIRLLRKRADRAALELKSLGQKTTQEFKAVRQEMKQGFRSVRQEMKQGLHSVRQEMEQGLQSVRQEMKQGFQAMRQEMAHALAHQGDALQKQINFLARQIAENEQRDAQFRNSMLSAVDSVMKQYESFQQEKAALGAGQDRLQQEVDQLRGAETRQNEDLRKLDERVTRLEAA